MSQHSPGSVIGLTGLSLLLLVVSWCWDVAQLNATPYTLDGHNHTHVVASITTAPAQAPSHSASRPAASVLDCTPLDPDVDDNGAVDIRDVSRVAAFFNHTAYPPAYDVNCTSAMDVLDVQGVADLWHCTECGESNPILAAWMINRTQETSEVMRDAGAPISVNVQDTYTQTINSVDYLCVESTGIPSYETEMTTTLHNWLNSRPKAATDFVTGQTTAAVGELIAFGEDIGYRSFSNTSPCPANQGYGYWPPGPSCPIKQTTTLCFPLDPQPSTSACLTGGNAIGLWVNGVRVFNWSDAMSYRNQGVWRNVAPKFEAYDLDICPGHAAEGEYHHHSHPACLQKMLGDSGQGHSPVYGFGADGYPIYGPWHDQDVLAQSCWKPRDYDNPSSETGCGVAGARTCFLVDPADPSAGTTAAPQSGPTTSEIVNSLSGNQILATSGHYIQDYYFDTACAAQGGAFLDEYNGHDHDGLGYHYHITIAENGDGTFSDVFPFYIGPRYRGSLPADSFAQCGGGPPPAAP